MHRFPLDGSPYAMSLGVRPLLDQPRLEPDPEQVRLKQSILDYQALPGSEELQQQAAVELGFHSFEQAGRQVAEDLLLLSGTGPRPVDWPLVAGMLAFPNDWCLADKLGRSLFEVHAPVPDFAAQVGDPTLKLLDKLKPGRPVWRANWAVKVTDRLDLSPAVNATFESVKKEITAANAGERCFFRIERQTLSRLPSGILFTVKTSVVPLQSLEHHERAALAATLRTVPPQMLQYKGIAPFVTPLLGYLDQSH